MRIRLCLKFLEGQCEPEQTGGALRDKADAAVDQQVSRILIAMIEPGSELRRLRPLLLDCRHCPASFSRR
jgi:hypothetical protein